MEGDISAYVLQVTKFTFQSTPSAWRETKAKPSNDAKDDISIHSLRMEGDVLLLLLRYVTSYFNPLPPHGGRLLEIFL